MSQHQWIVPFLWLAAVSVAGQTTNVTQCISSYNFSINALGQNPCLVAAYLESACGTPTNITAIPDDPPGEHYLGPDATEANPCRCSSVTYSMISACAGCQNKTYTDWLTWNEDCPLVSLTSFPKPLPNTVEVPIWAFLNVTLTGNNFSVVAAEENASASVASASTSSAASASAASASAASAIMTNTSVLTPTITSTASASKSKSNAGAIAGGVVGGLGFIAIVTLGALWFHIRRKRNRVAVPETRALLSIEFSGMLQTTGSTPGPSTSQNLYTSDRSIYPTSDTSGVFTSGIPPSRRSLESLSPSLAQFGGGPPSQNRSVQGGYTGRAEI